MTEIVVLCDICQRERFVHHVGDDRFCWDCMDMREKERDVSKPPLWAHLLGRDGSHEATDDHHLEGGPMTLDLFEQWCGGVHRADVLHPVRRRDPVTPVSPWCACDPAYSERGLIAHDCPLGVVEEYVEALQELGLTIREDR